MDTLDWTQLAGEVTPETGRIPYEPNKHLFKKVAFDVFQLNTTPVESLWTLEDSEDGTQYLVAMYGDEEPEQLEAKSHWEALADREGKNVTLMYKDAPIQRFASSEYGFNSEDVHVFQQTLVNRLASDSAFAVKFLKSQPKAKLDSLIAQFPELQSLATDIDPNPYNIPHGKESDWMPQSEQTDEDIDIEDAKIEAMHMAASAIRKVDLHDKFSKQDIQEIINSLAEELDAV